MVDFAGRLRKSISDSPVTVPGCSFPALVMRPEEWCTTYDDELMADRTIDKEKEKERGQSAKVI
jgi:hypothetical protein